jgi:hypothetical protein
MITFNDVASFDALMRSADDCCRGVMWKASTQVFKANQIRWCATLSRQLKTGTYKPKGFYEFDICERGKQRHIMAVHITDTGKIVMRLKRKNITRIRQKLKAMCRKGVEKDSAYQTYQSWRGYALNYNGFRAVKNIDRLFYELWR